jgi:hypothetical protein
LAHGGSLILSRKRSASPQLADILCSLADVADGPQADSLHRERFFRQGQQPNSSGGLRCGVMVAGRAAAVQRHGAMIMDAIDALVTRNLRVELSQRNRVGIVVVGSATRVGAVSFHSFAPKSSA